MIGRILYFALIVVPIVEIAIFVAVAQAFGFWPALAGVLLMSLVGAAIMRRQGFSLLAEIRATVGQGQMPARALADAMLVGIAGVLLVLPGYLTDLIGLLLLVPPLRHWAYRLLARRMGGRAAGASTTSAPRVIELDNDEFRSP